MKELIIQALNDAFVMLEKRIPQTKVEIKYINIEDVKPCDISKFINDNNIPNNAYFGGKPNGYDAFSEFCLCYEVNIPTTDKDKLKFNRKIFSDIAFKLVHDSLTNNGYKRRGYNSGLLKQFDDTTLYDMYIDKDFDRIVLYYSLPFVNKDDLK